MYSQPNRSKRSNRLVAITVSALLATIFSVVQTSPSVALTTLPPDGRANYTVSLMRDRGTDSFVRLAQYSLRADGSVRADYWAWNTQTIAGKAASGATTAGCSPACSVPTAQGFQNAPSSMFGTWQVQGSTLTITWSASQEVEVWELTTEATATKARLLDHPRADHGVGWGSTRGFTASESMSSILAKDSKYIGPYFQNNFGAQISGTTQLGLQGGVACSGSCVTLSTATNKIYFAGAPGTRKVFYSHEKYAVNPTQCILNGHLKPALQIIDDTGSFRGVVMVEASLYDLAYGKNILAIYDLNDFA